MQIYWTRPRVPVFIAPQIPRSTRCDTRDRYCRAILTLFRPWLTFNDLCNVSDTWNDALQHHEKDVSASSNRIIENIELMHECKNDRDEHLVQIINEIEQTDSNAMNHDRNDLADQAVDDLDNTDDLLELINFEEEITTDESVHNHKAKNDDELALCEECNTLYHTNRTIHSNC